MRKLELEGELVPTRSEIRHLTKLVGPDTEEKNGLIKDFLRLVKGSMVNYVVRVYMVSTITVYKRLPLKAKGNPPQLQRLWKLNCHIALHQLPGVIDSSCIRVIQSYVEYHSESFWSNSPLISYHVYTLHSATTCSFVHLELE